jgi:hypothetical protein
VIWQSDKTWSDRFIGEIKSILGAVLISTAEPEDDALRNTDLITLTLRDGLRVACRVRKHCYLADYGDEFTIRCSRPSGNETEMDKVLAGWGDFLFYGFADEQEASLAAWLVGDLAVFRDWHRRYLATHQDWPGELRSNHDGSSAFMVFGVHDIDPHFVVARKRAQQRSVIEAMS